MKPGEAAPPPATHHGIEKETGDQTPAGETRGAIRHQGGNPNKGHLLGSRDSETRGHLCPEVCFLWTGRLLMYLPLGCRGQLGCKVAKGLDGGIGE